MKFERFRTGPALRPPPWNLILLWESLILPLSLYAGLRLCVYEGFRPLSFRSCKNLPNARALHDDFFS